jgi:hypothetical protein
MYRLASFCMPAAPRALAIRPAGSAGLFAGKLTVRARALSAERRLKVTEHEAALGPIVDRAAHPDAPHDLLSSSLVGSRTRARLSLRLSPVVECSHACAKREQTTAIARERFAVPDRI